MKIGIIGSGIVGRTLAGGFINEGHEVMVGTRDISKEELVKFSGETGAALGAFNDAAKFGELLVICTKGEAAVQALGMIDSNNLSGKTIIDTTNPIASKPPENGVLHFFTTLDSSLMEELQLAWPNAYFVKAFNSVGNAGMYKPSYGGVKPTMFICGDNENARRQVTQILDSFGWETEDLGAATAARAIEPLCMLWCIPGFLKNQWSHAFKLLK